MLDDDKKDLGPFDEEFFDDDFEDDTVASNKTDPKQDFASLDDNDDNDDLADDKPSVSQTTKKNPVLIVGGALVLLFMLYQLFFTEKDVTKRTVKKPKNEAVKMSDEFREKSSVPKLTGDLQALSRAEQKQPEKATEVNQLIAAPPPPPLIESSSQFTNTNSGNSGLPQQGGLPSLGSSGNIGSGGSFNSGNRFGNNSGGGFSGGGSRGPALPELGGGFPSSGFSSGGTNNSIVSEDYRAKIQAPMFVMQSPDTAIIRERNQQAATSNGLPDSGYSLSLSSSGNRSDATYVGDLRNVILQGKVIDAVIETAINTDLPDSILRGVISRDVYSEKGNRVLIPKGSRLIGSYNTEVKFGQARVFIIWNRIIRPDGIDAVLDSNATDLLGRNGVYGKLDNRFFEIFGSSILLSSLSVAFSAGASELFDVDSSSSSAVDGSVVSNDSSKDQAIREAVTAISGDVTDIAEELLDTRPRILINQGSRIKIFVNRDIHFPASFSSEEAIQIIQ